MYKEVNILLKESKFKYLWASQIFSQISVNMMNFLLIFKLFASTGSTIATSLLWVFYALPAIFFGPIGSASADIFDRKKLLRVSVFAQAITVLIFAFLHQSKIFLLYGAVLSYSFFNQFYVPAEASSLPSLVPKKLLPQANGLFFLTQQAALVIGFSLSGLLRNTIGFNNSLFFCAFFLILAFITLSFLPKMQPDQEVKPNLENSVGMFFASIVEGYTYIRSTKQILSPFLLLGGAQVAMAILLVNIPVFVNEIFYMSVESAGFEVILPVAFGALAGAFISTKLLKSGWSKKRIVEICLMLMSASLYLLVFVVSQYQGFYSLLLGALLLFVSGGGFVGLIVSTQTYLQEKTPPDLRGRVFGNFWFIVTIASIFPVIFSGTITELFGIKMLLLILSGILFVVLIYSKKVDKSFLNDKQ